MKRFLYKILAFSGGIIVLYPIVIYIIGTYMPTWLRPNLQYLRNGDGYMLQRLAEADSIGPVDILFLGSSHTYQGYHPEYFPKYSTMNLGSSNQTHVQTTFLLKRYLSQLKPRLIVYEINPNMLYNDDTESTLDMLSNLNDEEHIWDLLHRDNIIPAMHTLMYKYISTAILRKEDGPPINDQYGDKYIGAGFVEKNKGNNTKFSSHEFIFMPPIVNARSLQALHDNIAIMQSHNTPFIFVYTPVTTGFYSATGMDKRITDVFNTAPYPCYNFNELATWNDTFDFYDEHHLNHQGVIRYNQLIAAIIDSTLQHYSSEK